MPNLFDILTVQQQLLEIVRAHPEDDQARRALALATMQRDEAWEAARNQ